MENINKKIINSYSLRSSTIKAVEDFKGELDIKIKTSKIINNIILVVARNKLYEDFDFSKDEKNNISLSLDKENIEFLKELKEKYKISSSKILDSIIVEMLKNNKKLLF